MEIKNWNMGARGWGCEWRSIDLGEAWRLRFLKDSMEDDPKFTECSSSYPSSLEDSWASTGHLGERAESIEQGSLILVPALSLLSTYDRSQWIFIGWVIYIYINEF